MVRAFHAISAMDCRSFHHLNEALLMQLPKVDNPVALNDYRPISLIHSFGKIFSKFMANRFALHLPGLVSASKVLSLKVVKFKIISDTSWARPKPFQ
jgi:hypothetical protein